MLRRIAWSLVACIAVAPAASAAPLSCEQFKDRLAKAVSDDGDKVAQIRDFKQGFQNDSYTEYNWQGIAGLTGSMMCSQTDEFMHFSASAEIGPDTPHEVVDRIRDLGSAVICALTVAQSSACHALANTMMNASARVFLQQKSRGELSPIGTRDYELAKDIDAEFITIPSEFNFTIGPGTHMDEIKLPLRPSPLDGQ